MLPLPDLITSFRQRFPHGSLTADLITLHNDQYVVRATVMSQTGQPLATALSSHQQIEIAEDQAKQRALASLTLGTDAAQPATQPTTAAPAKQTPAPSPQPSSQPSVSPPSPPKPPAPSPAPSRPEIPSLDAAPPAPAPAPDLDFPSPPDDDWDAESWGPPVEEPPAPKPAAASQPAPAPAPAPTSTPVANATSTADASAADTSDSTPVTDLSDVIAQTSVELSRLGWTVQQGRQYLEQTYNKRSRQDLTDEELFSFLFYLESLPTPAP